MHAETPYSKSAISASLFLDIKIMFLEAVGDKGDNSL
jgi:hypothetical protein